jgi:hypothetical protein
MVRVYAVLTGILFFCVPWSVRADEAYTPSPLTAADLLKQARAARGTLAPGSYKIVETSHGGGLDETSTTYLEGRDSITHVVAGPFSSAYGTYHDQEWGQDENGTVTLASGFHATANPNAAGLAHPEESASHVTLLGVTTAEPHEYAVDVNPPNGEHQLRYYDSTTLLLDRVVTYGKDRLKHVATYGDYRRAFGVMHAFHAHYSDGRPENDSDDVTTAFVLADAPPAMDIPESRSMFAFGSAQPVILPARFVDKSIIVRVNAGSRGLDFLLDTGAGVLAIDPSVAHDLGLKLYDKRSDTIGGSFDESRTIGPDLAIGEFQISSPVLRVIPIRDSYAAGTAAVGLLGVDFIASSVLGINFKRETVTAYPSFSFAPTAAMIKIPIELDDGIPRVAASFGGVPGRFLLDTGAGTTILYSSYFNRLPHTELLEGEWTSTFVGGEVPMKPYLVRDFSFGGITFRQAGILVPQTSTADIGDYDGIIGRDVLQEYTIFLDYGREAIYLMPNP